jgi:hypothetical protein
MKELMYIRSFSKRRLPVIVGTLLSVATTDAQVIVPVDSMYVGNPKSCIAVRVRSRNAYSRVRVEVAETPFFSRSVSEFVLTKPRTEYIIYPDIIWNYEALKNNNQAEPISVAVMVEMNGKDLGQRVRTFSVRSINECLLGYVTNGTKFHDTGIFFAAYVNEENPMIDKLLREALDTRIVNRFLGYQGGAEVVDRQVYALWNVLQKRKFRYSSVSNTSLSSNVVFSQRVRTFDDALESSQINCVDGSVLFASLLRAINHLREFAKRADKNEPIDMDIQAAFPHNELGEISQHIIQIYKRLRETKEALYIEREKLITHLQTSREGLGVFNRAS